MLTKIKAYVKQRGKSLALISTLSLFFCCCSFISFALEKAREGHFLGKELLDELIHLKSNL